MAPEVVRAAPKPSDLIAGIGTVLVVGLTLPRERDFLTAAGVRVLADIVCFHFFKVKAEGSDQVGYIAVQKPNCAMQIILTHVELALMPSDFVAGPTH